MQFKALLFDLDGTLADSTKPVLNFLFSFAQKEGLDPHLLLQEIRNTDLLAIFKKYRIGWLRAFFLIRDYRRLISRSPDVSKPIEDMPAFLSEAKIRGLTLGLITSNSEANTRAFLKNNGIAYLFDFLKGNIGLFGKTRAIKEFLKKTGMKASETAYIGDESRDIKAAKKAGVASIAVCWGMQSGELLKKYQPEFLAEKPEDLTKVIEKNR